MRSKMSTLASTAMPMVSTTPAMPLRVKVALIIAMTPRTKRMFTARAKLATMPSMK